MGKVNVIQKSRKECRCSKCGKTIPVGSKYYRGSINFHPDIVRCSDCGLESWEVTTSDYQLQAGEIVYRWNENYGVTEDAIESIRGDLESLAEELQERLDNMPESLQDSDTGMILQERIEHLQAAQNELDNVDVDGIKEEVLDEYNQALDEDEEELEELDWENPDQYSDVLDIVEAFETKLDEMISDALSVIEV